MDGMPVKRGRGRPRREGSTLVTKLHPIDPTVTLWQGRRGPESRIWEATFQFGDLKVGPRSPGHENETLAAFEAIRMKERLAAEVAKGQPITKSRAQHSFGEAADLAIAELEDLVKEARGTRGTSTSSTSGGSRAR